MKLALAALAFVGASTGVYAHTLRGPKVRVALSRNGQRIRPVHSNTVRLSSQLYF